MNFLRSIAFQIYYFPVNEAETPDLRVFCCYCQYFLFIKTTFQLISNAVSKSCFPATCRKDRIYQTLMPFQKSAFSGACQTARLSQNPKQVSVTKPNDWLKPDSLSNYD